MHILVIEDSRDLAASIGEYLEDRGDIVDYASDGPAGLGLATRHCYDALVLDINLPGLDGLSVCRRLRDEARRGVPVLMLTARDTEQDKLCGFEAGADDYLTKPFSLAELRARLAALSRRGRTAEELQVHDLSFDQRTLIARRGGRRLELAPAALRLLGRLMQSSPGLVTRVEAERSIWGDDPPNSDAALRLHVRSLRTAIERDGEPRLLHTIHGVGYRLACDDGI